MKQNKKLLALLLVLVIAFTSLALVACNKDGDKGGDQAKKVVRISTTTSVNDSGLMAYLQPYFKADTGYDWEIASAGTGAAIKAAKYGNADVILVHEQASEETFVTEGFSRVVDGYKTERVSFMYNYFVLVGPTNDPANVKNADNVMDAFANIASNEKHLYLVETQVAHIKRKSNCGPNRSIYQLQTLNQTQRQLNRFL